MMNDEPDTRKSVFARLAKREKRARLTADTLSALFARLGGEKRARLNRLWTDWEPVMGAGIASLSHPLGHNEDVLLVGADDAMAMQELSLLSQEILERANEHMGESFFTRVSVRLMQGRPDLARQRRAAAPPPTLPPYTPRRVGKYLGSFDPDSPVTQCYAAHVKAGEEGDGKE